MPQSGSRRCREASRGVVVAVEVTGRAKASGSTQSTSAGRSAAAYLRRRYGG